MQALNQVIDLQELRTRLFAVPTHVPGIVYLLLYTIATAAIGFSGYTVALEGKQERIPYVILGVLVVIVIGVIANIDRPWGGFVKVSQQPTLTFRRACRVSWVDGLRTHLSTRIELARRKTHT